MNKLKVYFVSFFLIVMALACSTFSGSNPDNANIEDSGGEANEPTSTLMRQDATDTPTPPAAQQKEDELPPLSYEELLEARVEAGEWTEEEGLLTFLKYFVGEVREDEIPGVADVVIESGSVVVNRADQYLENPDADGETSAEIERILRMMFPPQDVLDAISIPVDENSALPSAKLAALGQPVPSGQSEQEACISLAQNGYDPTDIEGQICLLYRERILTNGNAIRVYFPIWTEDSEDIFATINSLLNVLEETALTYDSLNGLIVEDFYFLYWPFEEIENLSLSSYFDNNTDICNIGHQFRDISSDTLRQFIAYQMFQCVLKWTYVESGFGWWMWGTPWYFSNIVYPLGDMEWQFMDHFDRVSVDTPLYDIGHTNFILFQFLGNVYGPQTVVEIMGELNANNYLLPYIAPGTPGDFNRFVVDYLSMGIADENTGNYFLSPSPPRVTDTITVDEVGEYILEGEYLVARRYFVDYKEQKRFLQVEADSDYQVLTTVKANLHWSRSAWSGVPPEIRSECDQDVRYLYVPTFIGPEDPGDFNAIRVTTAEQAVCDPCLLGAWKIDNLSFSEYMDGIFENYVPGAEGFQTLIEGDYFLQFDTEGKMQAQREDMIVHYSMNDLGYTPPLDATNPGPQPTQMLNVTASGSILINSNGIGNYSADGETLKVTQFVDVVEETAGTIIVNSGFFAGMGSYAGGADLEPDETVTYTCEGDILEMSMPYYEYDLRLDRVENILPTPIPTPSEYDDQP